MTRSPDHPILPHFTRSPDHQITRFLDVSPMSSIARHQLIRLFWSPASRGVVREFAWGQRLPYVENRIDYGPTSFHHIGALEQRRIADHAVVEQDFIPRLSG